MDGLIDRWVTPSSEEQNDLQNLFYNFHYFLFHITQYLPLSQYQQASLDH